MTVYSISYDLNTPGQKYTDLYDELKLSPDWWHFLDSTWLVATSETAEQLAARLLRHLDKNDRILIIKVTKPYQGWLSDDAWEWINRNVTA